MAPAGSPLHSGTIRLPVFDHGNYRFNDDVEQCLQTLRVYAPWRYRELLEHLPKAEYLPESPRFQGNNYIAFSDGIFRWDSTRYPNGIEGFTHTLLHECFHNMPGGTGPDCEARSNAYADLVLDEVRRARSLDDLSPNQKFVTDLASAWMAPEEAPRTDHQPLQQLWTNWVSQR